MAGRPTSLTHEVSETIMAAVRVGNYLETAAALAGISVSTLRKWMRDGARDRKAGNETANAAFSAGVKKALAQAESESLQRVDKASEIVWQAACWRLERRWPDRWGRERVEIRELKKRLMELEKLLVAERALGN